ncbi:hypothetical protein ACLBOM_12015 [Escherichia coli]
MTRRAEQAIWPADALPAFRPQFASKSVYDYRTDSTVNSPLLMKAVTPVLASFIAMRKA